MPAASIFTYPDIVLTILFKLNMLLGVVAIWQIYDFCFYQWKESKFWSFFAGNVFMVYVIHEPLQHVLFDLLLQKNTGNLMHTFAYIVLPVMFILLGSCIGELLRKVPVLHRILTGGR